MLKLIAKDFSAFWYILASNCVFILALMSFGMIFDANGNMTFIGLIMYPMVLPTVLLINDEKYATLMNALPNRRSSYVLSKYGGGLLFSLLLLTIGLIYGYIMTSFIVTDGIRLAPIFSLNGFTFFVVPIVLITSLSFPIFFRFSKGKGTIVLSLLFAFALLGMIIGLVYVEKNLITDELYSQYEVFPVIMSYITDYITRIGTRPFVTQLLLVTLGLLLTSVATSLYIYGRKDIGGV